jgi:hypothetical protein
MTCLRKALEITLLHFFDWDAAFALVLLPGFFSELGIAIILEEFQCFEIIDRHHRDERFAMTSQHNALVAIGDTVDDLREMLSSLGC